MPCGVHDKLERDWKMKVNAEISAHDGYKGSIKAMMFQRSLMTSERTAAETVWQNHIKGCDICTSEGREPRPVNHDPIFK